MEIAIILMAVLFAVAVVMIALFRLLSSLCLYKANTWEITMLATESAKVARSRPRIFFLFVILSMMENSAVRASPTNDAIAHPLTERNPLIV